MGKQKTKKFAQENKQKIKAILETHKQLLTKNTEKFGEIDPTLTAKNIFEMKTKKITKKRSHQEIIDFTPNSRKNSNIISEIPVLTVNLFEVKKYENEQKIDEIEIKNEQNQNIIDQSNSIRNNDFFQEVNPFRDEFNNQFLQDDINQNYNESSQNYHIMADQEEDIFDSKTQNEQEHDFDLKKYVISYDPILKQINEIKIDKNKNLLQNPFLKQINDKSEISLGKQLKNDLPIFQKEYDIIEAMKQNLVTIVCGSTGSGKSTQVPQFACQSGFLEYGSVIVTQPRRIAAISLAKRVAEETNTEIGQLVGFQVRFEAKFSSEETKLMYVTDGILMNELMSDFLLSKYSVVIIDEAHERKMASDVLIGILSRIVKIRAKLALNEYQSNIHPKIHPLRLVLMSATLKVEDFVNNRELFSTPPPLISISVKRFPVHIYFSKETVDDYLIEGIKKARKIHSSLPQGNLLIFLTGREEILKFCKELYNELKYIRKTPQIHTEIEDNSNIFEQILDNENIEMQIEQNDEKTPSEIDQSDKINDENDEKEDNFKDSQGFYVSETFVIIPLYSKLSSNYQDKIFRSFEGKRVIIVGTNVAETSITIEGLKYIIDCGKEKNKIFDPKNSLEKYQIDWISQSSAKQRTGRVGRTQTGYCYRLYTPAVYGKFFKHKDPEIMNLPLNYTILQMVKMGIQNVIKFPFPTRPETSRLVNSIEELIKLETIIKLNDEFDLEATLLGETLSCIPLEPKYSKIILQCQKS